MDKIAVLLVFIINEGYMVGRKNEIVNSILASLISSHGNMRMEDLSTMYCLNRCHLSRLVKRNSGQSFRTLRTIFRIHSMMKLAKTTNLSAKEIANRVGIHPNYLYILFKRASGMTVKEYRKRVY